LVCALRCEAQESHQEMEHRKAQELQQQMERQLHVYRLRVEESDREAHEAHELLLIANEQRILDREETDRARDELLNHHFVERAGQFIERGLLLEEIHTLKCSNYEAQELCQQMERREAQELRQQMQHHTVWNGMEDGSDAHDAYLAMLQVSGPRNGASAAARPQVERERRRDRLRADRDRLRAETDAQSNELRVVREELCSTRLRVGRTELQCQNADRQARELLQQMERNQLEREAHFIERGQLLEEIQVLKCLNDEAQELLVVANEQHILDRVEIVLQARVARDVTQQLRETVTRLETEAYEAAYVLV